MAVERDPHRVLAEAIAHVAPDVDVDAISADGNLREEAELDSMDLLNIVAAIHEATGVEIPERDYPYLSTWSTFINYLSGRL